MVTVVKLSIFVSVPFWSF